jgi:hypothetical protein
VALGSISRWSISAHAGASRAVITPMVISNEIESDMKLWFIFPLPAGTMAGNYSEADSAEHMERRWRCMIRRGQ